MNKSDKITIAVFAFLLTGILGTDAVISEHKKKHRTDSCEQVVRRVDATEIERDGLYARLFCSQSDYRDRLICGIADGIPEREAYDAAISLCNKMSITDYNTNCEQVVNRVKPKEIGIDGLYARFFCLNSCFNDALMDKKAEGIPEEIAYRDAIDKCFDKK